jgi:hypothetical protein
MFDRRSQKKLLKILARPRAGRFKLGPDREFLECEGRKSEADMLHINETNRLVEWLGISQTKLSHCYQSAVVGGQVKFWREC